MKMGSNTNGDSKSDSTCAQVEQFLRQMNDNVLENSKGKKREASINSSESSVSGIDVASSSQRRSFTGESIIDQVAACQNNLMQQQQLEALNMTPSVVDLKLPEGGTLISELNKLAPMGRESVGLDIIRPQDILRLDENVKRQKKCDKPEVDFYGRPLPTDVVRKFPSMLMYLITRANDDEWQEVVDRTRSHPQEVALQGVNGGMTAMHGACIRYPPLHVVQAMLEVDEAVALKRNFSGETPLHIASYAASEEVQALLVRTVPLAASRLDQYGDSPLHFAARAGATYYVMEALVAADPTMISQPNNRGITPFWMLPRTFLEADDLDEVLDVDGEDHRDDWDSLTLFLRYSYFLQRGCTLRVRDEKSNPLPIRRKDYTWVVHAAAATPSCPREVLKWLCRMFPEQALKLDHKGYTPLLLAVQQQELKEPKNWNELEDGFREYIEVVDGELQNEGDRLNEDEAALHAGDSDFLERILQHAGEDVGSDMEDSSHGNSFEVVKESVVEVLLEWSQRSALQADAVGRWPLTHALLSGMGWKTSIAKLITACPRALEVQDPVTGLYNFQLAAMCSPQLDTVYTIVRSLPELLPSRNKWIQNISKT